MGAQRIQEVTMFALLFLLIGVIFLLVAAGRIWIDRTSLDSRSIDSATANSLGEQVTLSHMSEGKDSRGLTTDLRGGTLKEGCSGIQHLAKKLDA